MPLLPLGSVSEITGVTGPNANKIGRSKLHILRSNTVDLTKKLQSDLVDYQVIMNVKHTGGDATDLYGYQGTSPYLRPPKKDAGKKHDESSDSASS